MVARLKLTLNGFLCSGAERWCIGLYFAGTPGMIVSGLDVQTWSQQCAGVVATHEDDEWVAGLSSAGGVDRVDALYYPLSGPSTLSGSTVMSPAVTGNFAPDFPPQIARVHSLRTGLAGKRYRGRAYVPCQYGSIGTNGKSTPGANHATQFGQMLNDFAAAWPGDEPIEPVVYSEMGNSVTPVTQVLVGDVLDTQRRRRDALSEIYQVGLV